MWPACRVLKKGIPPHHTSIPAILPGGRRGGNGEFPGRLQPLTESQAALIRPGVTILHSGGRPSLRALSAYPDESITLIGRRRRAASNSMVSPRDRLVTPDFPPFSHSDRTIAAAIPSQFPRGSL
jgi:hypothetical protein